MLLLLLLSVYILPNVYTKPVHPLNPVEQPSECYLSPPSPPKVYHWTPESPVNLWELSGRFQGDLVSHQVVSRGERCVLKQGVDYWPEAVVPVSIGPGFGFKDMNILKKALRIIEDKTCIRFPPRQENHTSYVELKGDLGYGECWSYLGRISGNQTLSLGEGCVNLHHALHEICHALGLVHQHSSPDRDDYINIHWENIDPDFVEWFDKYTWDEYTDFGLGYDYYSVMHYSAYIASSNGKPTLSAKDPDVKIEPRTTLSDKDVQKLNMMYCSDGAYARQFNYRTFGGYVVDLVDDLSPFTRHMIILLTAILLLLVTSLAGNWLFSRLLVRKTVPDNPEDGRDPEDGMGKNIFLEKEVILEQVLTKPDTKKILRLVECEKVNESSNRMSMGKEMEESQGQEMINKKIGNDMVKDVKVPRKEGDANFEDQRVPEEVMRENLYHGEEMVNSEIRTKGKDIHNDVMLLKEKENKKRKGEGDTVRNIDNTGATKGTSEEKKNNNEEKMKNECTINEIQIDCEKVVTNVGESNRNNEIDNDDVDKEKTNNENAIKKETKMDEMVKEEILKAIQMDNGNVTMNLRKEVEINRDNIVEGKKSTQQYKINQEEVRSVESKGIQIDNGEVVKRALEGTSREDIKMEDGTRYEKMLMDMVKSKKDNIDEEDVRGKYGNMETLINLEEVVTNKGDTSIRESVREMWEGSEEEVMTKINEEETTQIEKIVVKENIEENDKMSGEEEVKIEIVIKEDETFKAERGEEKTTEDLEMVIAKEDEKAKEDDIMMRYGGRMKESKKSTKGGSIKKNDRAKKILIERGREKTRDEDSTREERTTKNNIKIGKGAGLFEDNNMAEESEVERWNEDKPKYNDIVKNIGDKTKEERDAKNKISKMVEFFEDDDRAKAKDTERWEEEKPKYNEIEKNMGTTNKHLDVDDKEITNINEAVKPHESGKEVGTRKGGGSKKTDCENVDKVSVKRKDSTKDVEIGTEKSTNNGNDTRTPRRRRQKRKT
ncbi:uncharacterized protein LOC129004936 [Macrosteles quadrilineatus]|uniref:uncharacterized protein LOC129004936 n=1 Tax=Macrosteles quadrilineatus TaxID=74068 RepID=UPI0023E26AA8|nr:uncharacterized protein LOC129004936 [Macrosteles quadrilineatus]